MVYFVSHVILFQNRWITLTNIPVNLVNLSEDFSSRKLNTITQSLQLVWQPGRFMKPLFTSVIKTNYIILFQRKIRNFLVKRKRLTLPKYILKREIYGTIPNSMKN